MANYIWASWEQKLPKINSLFLTKEPIKNVAQQNLVRQWHDSSIENIFLQKIIVMGEE